MFRAAFNDYPYLWIIILDYIVEGVFFLEVLTKYVIYPFIRILNHVDTLKSVVIREIISLRVWFDVIPLVFTVIQAATGIRLLLLLRMFRLWRFWGILDKVGDELIKGLLKKIVNLVTRSRENQLLYVSFFFIFIRIFIISFKALVITYFVASGFWIVSYNTREEYPKNFVDNFGLSDLGPFEQMLWTSYFILTTLTTIGYGDMFPISVPERIYGILVQISGVAFFSYIMGKFISIIQGYNEKTIVED